MNGADIGDSMRRLGEITPKLPHPDNKRLQNNNFDLLRMFFAGTVCLVHAVQLSGYEQLRMILSVLSSSVAVKAFFVVSGFLIFMSFERSSSFSSYIQKRIRRIYPAYFFVIVLSAFSLLAVSNLQLGEYFSFAWIKYLIANLSFLNFIHPSLPGVFESNRLESVNGALWTLKIEVMFYLTVPLLVILSRKFSHLFVLVSIYLVSFAYSVFMTGEAERTGMAIYTELARQLPGQLSYFLAGALLYYYFAFFERNSWTIFIASMIVLSLNTVAPLSVFEPIALASIVIFAATYLYLGNFGKYGDFSYGIYIVHFPIIQLMLDRGWFSADPWYFLLVAAALTVLTSVALWHFVEKRFLHRSAHYSAAASATAGIIPILKAD